MGRGAYDTTGIPSIPRQRAEESETPYSICSADTPSIEEGHPLFQLKDTCLQVVMAEFMQVRGRKQDQSDRAEGISSTETSFGHPSDRSRKRGRSSDGASVVTNEKQTHRGPAKRRTQDRRVWLACPYAKKDPIRYRDCYSYDLSRVRDVKQHLMRCHSKPLYCPTCNDTFEDEDEKDAHIRSRACPPRPSIVIEGMSENQKKELRKRVSAKMQEDQQWFAVFDILFHPHPRPRTPYRDKELSEDLNVFQDFMTAQGPTILAEVLASKGVIGSNLPQEERDLAAFKKEILEEGLNRIIEQWTNDSATAMGENNTPHSPPSSFTVDSGIAMQTDRSQTADESRKADNESGFDRINAGMDSERQGEDQHTSVPFRQAQDLGLEADIFHTGSASDFRFQFTVDKPATSLERIPIHLSHHRPEVSVSPATSQSIIPSDYPTLLPAADSSLDLYDFDISGWPT
ncbi:hypothetical protein F4820DRAFT_342101 [Hypoxylon rubiginosum]|uniref:Uncharacterized protein n=1 Tax=Hypoxylon rubiginosum TaxID=110542 RepID=A0ACB9ZEF1_9PEZI|nr:hypothetical protein F4820DRAFT_342101 [Hypoxylon rubiginosum]